MKSLTKPEIGRLLVRIDNARDMLLIQMGLVLGCRVSEITSIRLKNIHPDRLVLWDEKKNTFRECVLDQETRGQLEDYLRSDWRPKPHRPHQLFYMSPKTVNRIVKRWFAAAAITAEKAHWHTLRHTYIVQSLEAGVPLNHIIEQTGDSPATILKVYGCPGIDSRRAMINERGRYWK